MASGTTASSLRLILWLIVVVPLSVALIVLSQLGVLSPLENTVMTVFSPAGRGIRNALGPVADWGRYDAIRDENRRLRRENERLLAEVAQLRESLNAQEDMAKLLNIQQEHPNDQFVLSNVIARGSGHFKDTISIDKGTHDGLAEGMVVLSEDGALVGTITKVHHNFAWVTLITDQSSNITAMIADSRVMGVVTGNIDRRLKLEFVPQQAEVQPGDIVVTSGMGGNYPKSLLIGRIVSISGNRQDLFWQIYIEPAASLSRLERVAVLVSFLPIEVAQP